MSAPNLQKLLEENTILRNHIKWAVDLNKRAKHGLRQSEIAQWEYEKAEWMRQAAELTAVLDGAINMKHKGE